MTMLDDLSAYLEAEGVGTVGTDIFMGFFLDSYPDQIVVLYETSGLGDLDNFGSETLPVIERPGLQLRVRSEPWDYEGGRALAEQAKNALLKVANEDLSGNRYFRVQHESGPFPINRDDQERIHFTVNFVVHRAP